MYRQCFFFLLFILEISVKLWYHLTILILDWCVFMNNNMITILICDDSILVRKKMKDTLSKIGNITVLEASDGEQAVAQYMDKKPDLVFMDIVMPKKNGVEALKEILSFDKSAKVVIVSSVGTQGNLKEAIEAGAYDFLQKPISDDSVIKIIKGIK
jgi:two-component system chemotaxis response regulator CheY